MMAELTGWHFHFLSSSWHRKKRDFDQNGPLSIHVPSTVISSVNEEVRKDICLATKRRGEYTKMNLEEKANVAK